MRTKTKARTAHAIDAARLERLSVMGPTIQFVTGPDDDAAACIMRGVIPAGVSVPLHSHADPETFLLVSGAVEGLTWEGEEPSWGDIPPGTFFHVPGGVKHAWRNRSVHEATMIVVTTPRLGRFLREVSVPIAEGGPPPGPPSQEQIDRFLSTAARYGYWNAGPDENARVGIQIP